MRIVFAGTPEFAVPALRALCQSPHPIVGVYTQPDRPAGRGQKLTPSPVKQTALETGLPVFQPETLRSPEAQDELRALNPDLMVVVAYGLILPPAVIAIPPLGCVNIHASLLPRWRGAAPIQRAILAGDAVTGVTIMFIETRLDAGPMLHRKSCPIRAGESAGALHDRLAILGAEALMETLPALATGTAQPEIQDERHVTHAAKFTKEDAWLDWRRPALELERQVRAMNPWPVAATLHEEQPFRIWQATALNEPAGALPGVVLNRSGTLDVATGAGVLRLQEVQLPGARRIQGLDFRNAHPGPSIRLGH